MIDRYPGVGRGHPEWYFWSLPLWAVSFYAIVALTC
jgi:hypothetical protein